MAAVNRRGKRIKRRVTCEPFRAGDGERGVMLVTEELQ